MTNREYVASELERGFVRYSIPEHIRGGIRRYVLDGIEPGDFLREAFADRLVAAFGRADAINTAAMRDIAAFLYDCVPTACRGGGSATWKGLPMDEDDEARERREQQLDAGDFVAGKDGPT